MWGEKAPVFGAASDGDGARRLARWRAGWLAGTCDMC